MKIQTYKHKQTAQAIFAGISGFSLFLSRAEPLTHTTRGKCENVTLIQISLGSISVVLNERSVGVEISLCCSTKSSVLLDGFCSTNYGFERIRPYCLFSRFACSLVGRFIFEKLALGVCADGDGIFSYVHVPCVVCMYISQVCRVEHVGRESAVRDDRVARWLRVWESVLGHPRHQQQWPVSSTFCT